MKTNLSNLLFLIALLSNFMIIKSVQSQTGTWVEKQFVPESQGVDFAASFAIGDKGYVVTGETGIVNGCTLNLWEYDQLTDTWSSKAEFPGLGRRGAVAFSIGNKAYVGTGISCDNSILTDFWEWDQQTDSWSQKADFPGTPRTYAAGFSIGSKGYLGTGAVPGMSWTYFQDFWEYNPANDTWTQKADLPGMRYGAAGFSIGNKGYICAGDDNIPNTYFPNTLFEYDSLSDSWTEKAKIPSTMGLEGSGRCYPAYFCVGNKVYIGTGTYVDPSISWLPMYTNDFWSWDQDTDTWTDLGVFGGDSRQWAIGFSVGNTGYIGTGEYSGDVYNDLWAYDTQVGITPVDNEIFEFYPNPAYDHIVVSTEKSETGSKCLIADQFGRTVLLFELTGKKSIIDISGLSTGLYFVVVDNKAYKLLKK